MSWSAFCQGGCWWNRIGGALCSNDDVTKTIMSLLLNCSAKILWMLKPSSPPCQRPPSNLQYQFQYQLFLIEYVLISIFNIHSITCILQYLFNCLLILSVFQYRYAIQYFHNPLCHIDFNFNNNKNVCNSKTNFNIFKLLFQHQYQYQLFNFNYATSIKLP